MKVTVVPTALGETRLGARLTEVTTFATIPYTLMANVVTLASISPSVASPRMVGTTITFTASSLPANVSAEYQWLLMTPGGEWNTVGTWTTSPFAWNTTGLQAGDYSIGVWAKAAGAPEAQAAAALPYTLSQPVVTSVNITPDLSSPRQLGTSISFTASVPPSEVGAEYQWLILPPGGSWTTVGTWTTDPLVWNTVGLDRGSYSIGVWARATGASVAQVSRAIPFALQTLVPTQRFDTTWGTVKIGGVDAPVGTLVEAFSPRGDLVGSATVTTAGYYGYMRVYGEDTTASPHIVGMRAGETITYRVTSPSSSANAGTSIWQNEPTPRQVNLAS